MIAALIETFNTNTLSFTKLYCLKVTDSYKESSAKSPLIS